MDKSRSWTLFFLKSALLTIGVVSLLRAYPGLTQGATPQRSDMITALLALGSAVVFIIVNVVIDRTLGDDEDPGYDVLHVAQDLALRTAGVVEVGELATGTAAVIDAVLHAPRSAWLLLVPEDGLYRAQPVAGKGLLAVESIHLSRNNPLLRQLDLRRRPVHQSEVDSQREFRPMDDAERSWLKKLDMEIFVPVLDAGILTAVLAVGRRGGLGGRFREPDLDLLMVLAGQAGTSLKTIRVVADLKRVNASLSTVNASLRESMDALAKMDSARSDFLAIASHELRTPISQLLGFADLLGSLAGEPHLEPGMIEEITGSIVRACGRLDEVISQMLEMAELDVDAMDLTYGDTTIEQIMRKALEPYASALRERQMNLSVKGLRSVPPLRADESRLVRAFSQLISNAIKYTPDGGRIEVSARLLPQDGEATAQQIEVVVADSGIGLDERHHGLIFEKFYRIGSTSVHSTGNTKFMGAGPGLGLPIAKGFIERHGGRIWVESPGHDLENLPGTKFFVTLPVRPPAFDPKALSQTESRLAKEGKKEVTLVPGKNPFVGIE